MLIYQQIPAFFMHARINIEGGFAYIQETKKMTC